MQNYCITFYVGKDIPVSKQALIIFSSNNQTLLVVLWLELKKNSWKIILYLNQIQTGRIGGDCRFVDHESRGNNNKKFTTWSHPWILKAIHRFLMQYFSQYRDGN